MVVDEGPQGLVRDARHAPTHLPGEEGEEVLHLQRDVIASLAQRRQPHRVAGTNENGRGHLYGPARPRASCAGMPDQAMWSVIAFTTASEEVALTSSNSPSPR